MNWKELPAEERRQRLLDKLGSYLRESVKAGEVQIVDGNAVFRPRHFQPGSAARYQKADE